MKTTHMIFGPLSSVLMGSAGAAAAAAGSEAASGWPSPLLSSLMSPSTAFLLALLALLLVVWRRAAAAAAAESSPPPLSDEPYPGYFLRHGRGAMTKSAKNGCNGLSAKELGKEGVVIVDVNNVRGKFGFKRADTIGFAGVVSRWAHANNLAGQVLLAVDHGPRQAVVRAAGAVFCFSGPGLEADDTIVFDIDWFLRHGRVPLVVVTSDKDLKRRCRAELNAYLERNPDAAEELLGPNRPLLRIIDSGSFAGWISTSGWPEYQVNCCVDGLCSCRPASVSAATTTSARDNQGGQRRKQHTHARPMREHTADRVRLAHRAFDIVQRVAAKASKLVSNDVVATRWHIGYAAWVDSGRVREVATARQ